MPIHAISETAWVLETKNTAYALALNDQGALVHTYWGARLPHPSDYPMPPRSEGYASFNGPGHLWREEYPAYGGGLKYTEPCLKVSFADGVRDCWLSFAQVEVDAQSCKLIVRLHDPTYGLEAHLEYTAHEACDIIERGGFIRCDRGQATLERAFSAQWHLPYGDAYRLTHFTGRWNDEFILRREPLAHGVKVLESRRLTTSHHHHPSFFLDRGTADEDQGEVWFGTLAYSGNWKLCAEVTDFGSTRLSLGINDWDFAWELSAGQTFRLPSCFGGYSAAGFGQASRNLHELIRARLPNPNAPRKVLFNSWEVSYFAVDVESQKHYAELAAELGVELFVMDDGWFKGRLYDNAGLGDWTPDPQKFPDGLKPLIDHVKNLGMDFGLWVEPEMVNPDSDLYRQHPDWVLHFPNRPRTTARNQLILNLARADVRQHLMDALSRLLRENAIDFIKWDMNRNASEVGWGADGPPQGDARQIWVAYTDGLYELWGGLARQFPHVTWQTCSGGGGRVDAAMLTLADQAWISDNTDPTRRLPMQDSYSYVFPLNTLESWVTDMGAPYLPLTLRFHVSMAGVLGIGANITRWNDSQKALAKRLIAQYKQLRPIIQRGKVYRLLSAQPPATTSALLVLDDRADEGVLFVYRTYAPSPTLPTALRLRGLIPEARYRLDGLGEKSGAAWMHSDALLSLDNFESRLLRLKRID
ncbi:MAG: alpha-galactosidase [Anaerolineae bacterium]|nr:alpha-galactosidase [Anaerolineae bacterium]MDW8171967.1 alpha-galactosidase [Anaerolineae bacterium]